MFPCKGEHATIPHCEFIMTKKPPGRLAQQPGDPVMQTLQASDAIFRRKLRFLTGLGERAHHVAATQAAGADVHTLRRAVDHNADILNIGSPDAVGLTVGVADVVTVQRALAANFAILTHGKSTSLLEYAHIKALLL